MEIPELTTIPPPEPTLSATPPGRPAWTYAMLPIALIVAGALIAGSILYTRGSTGTPKPKKINFTITAQDHILGNPKAKTTIVEFSDFQCPFCRSFWKDTYPGLKSQYIDTGKVRLIYRHFPLSFHSMAYPSALATECAADQGKFWELHDKIFGEQGKQGTATITYTVADIQKWAGQIGIDVPKLKQCMDADMYKDKIAQDTQNGSDAGVDGTPTFFINGVPLVGALPLSEFAKAIDGK